MTEKAILVTGGTGRTGQHIVRKLLDQGFEVRILTRIPDRANKYLGDNVTLFVGDVRDRATLEEPITGVQGIIAAHTYASTFGSASPKRIDYEGTANLVELALQNSLRHFVYISTIYVTRPWHYLNTIGRILTWKRRAEKFLQSGKLPYTIVRPGWLTDDPGGRLAIKMEQGGRGSGQVSREDVAEVCVQALLQHSAQGKTFELFNTEGHPPTDWNTLFDEVAKDMQNASIER